MDSTEPLTFVWIVASPFGMLNKTGNTVSIELARQSWPLPVGFRSSDA